MDDGWTMVYGPSCGHRRSRDFARLTNAPSADAARSGKGYVATFELANRFNRFFHQRRTQQRNDHRFFKFTNYFIYLSPATSSALNMGGGGRMTMTASTSSSLQENIQAFGVLIQARLRRAYPLGCGCWRRGEMADKTSSVESFNRARPALPVRVNRRRSRRVRPRW
jgi:hypothetical protein